MLHRLAITFLSCSLFAAAVDMTGTWKLNTAKSSYKSIPAPKELVATYTAEGTGWRYQGKGISATGEPINSSFTYVKDNEEITATGFPNWDTMILRNANAEKATGTMKRGGKIVGTVTRTISADGKTMTLRGNVTTPEGKKGSYTAVYEKQE